MKITNKEKQNKVKFSSLSAGTVFQTSLGTYIKTSEMVLNSVNLKTGNSDNLSQECLVIVPQAELVVEV